MAKPPPRGPYLRADGRIVIEDPHVAQFGTDEPLAAPPPGHPAWRNPRLAEPRSWRVELPAGLQLLNANHRGSWHHGHRVTAMLRETTAWAARMNHIPPLHHAHVLAEYQPPDRRRRDPANLYPSVKACVDGLVDARVLPDDDAAHLAGPDMRLGPPCPRGRLVLTITEIGVNPTGGNGNV